MMKVAETSWINFDKAYYLTNLTLVITIAITIEQIMISFFLHLQ